MDMEAVFAALIAAAASLVGVIVGIVSNRESERRQDRVLDRAQRREDLADRRRAAGLIADQFIGTIRRLRSLDEQHFEEMVEEVFLPRQWYESDEPALLRLLGDIEDANLRNALTEIVTSISDRNTHGEGRTRYHYIESQLLLGLQVANAYGRGDNLDSEMTGELEALRRRRALSSK